MISKNSSHFAGFTLAQWLCYIESIHSSEIDLGLDRVGQVAKKLFIDFSFAKVVTVAGTNGKGTTCAFIENALLNEKQSVAVYSSPHINQFNERLRINKTDIDDKALIDAFALVESTRGDISLSYYEFTTLACFVVLMKVKPSFIILEVGLGGRLDATNIINADIAIVTTIDLDHQAFLGNTRELIGFEKAGIFRTNKPAIIGDTSAPETVLDYAKQISARLYVRNIQFSVEQSKTSWQCNVGDEVFENLILPFIPIDNVATALMALKLLAINLTPKKVNDWVLATKVPGRMEFFSSSCPVILDVAHNPQAARYLANQIQHYKNEHQVERIIAVCSMLKDKDIYQSLQALTAHVELWHIALLDVPRAASVEELSKNLQQLGVTTSKINCFDNISQAFKMASQNAKTNDLIVVFGSFYTVAEIRLLLV
jgi:dihydrofolate synthase/folylpolyglutamate synthase